MEEFNILENGIDIQLGGETKKVHFVPGLIVGDNIDQQCSWIRAKETHTILAKQNKLCFCPFP